MIDYKEFEFTLLSNGLIVAFNETSKIEFFDKDDECIFMLDPSELSILYAAYRTMVKETIEEENWHNIKGDK